MEQSGTGHSRIKWIGALVAGMAAVVCAMILSRAYNFKFHQQETLSVTGAAEQNFVSDLIVWNASFTRHDFDLRKAFNALKEDELKVREYLHQNGLQDSSLEFSSVRIEKLTNTRYDSEGRVTGSDFAGYQLIQTIKVESQDIHRIDKISREITGLIQQGVEMKSQAPSYYYTQLGTLKIDLLAKASEDGRKRAETIAKNAGSSLGAMKRASMGIFQITGQNENEEYSYGGTFNTSSLNKTATITVRMDFGVE